MTNPDIPIQNKLDSDRGTYFGLLQGDPHIWFAFYEEYKLRLDSFFRDRNVFDEQDREDLIQQTMCLFFETLARFDLDRASLKNWVYGIARNVMLKNQRVFSSTYHNEESGDAALMQAGLTKEETDNDTTQTVSPEIALLKEAMANLTDKDREIIHIRLERNATWEELAEEYGASAGSMRTHYGRALEKLKRSFKDRLAG